MMPLDCNFPTLPSRSVRATTAIAVVALLGMGSAACSSDNSASKDPELTLDDPRVSTIKKDGIIIKRFDLDGNGDYDIIKRFETYEDPDNEGVTKRRMVEKRVDVNADGQVDIVTEYNDRGKRKKETVDGDLDGTPDFVNFYDNDAISRKEVFGKDGETVRVTRFYGNGKLDRVERDRNNDGKVDYWEYYEEGQLQRIGRDRNGDEKIDTWTHRAKERTAQKTETPNAPEGPDIGKGGDATGGTESSSEDGGDEK